MKNILLLISIFVFCIGCTPNAKNEKNIQDTTTVNVAIDTTAQHGDTIPMDSDDEQYADYYILIADTNKSYYVLRNEMIALNKLSQIPIDTMGRYYNPTKKLICLPDTSSDEIYAGEYYPRRFPSNSLSLEYLNLYTTQASEITIALVAGIFSSNQDATKELAKVKKTNPTAFVTKAEMFVGCMH